MRCRGNQKSRMDVSIILVNKLVKENLTEKSLRTGLKTAWKKAILWFEERALQTQEKQQQENQKKKKQRK